MRRELDHLQLQSWNQHSALRKNPSPRKGKNVDSAVHGSELLQQVEGMVDHLDERRKQTPQYINPRYIFKLKLRPGMDLDEDYLGRMGLTLLALETDHALVVFPDKEMLDKLDQRVRAYAGVIEGHKYEELSAIESIVGLTSEDRTGSRLQAVPLSDAESTALDIELWHTGNEQDCLRQVKEITNYLQGRSVQVTDTYIGEHLCLMRAKLDIVVLMELLKIDYVKEIERRPEPTFSMFSVFHAALQDFTIDSEVPNDLVGILILDSGVMTGHPILGPAIGDARVFLDPVQQATAALGSEDGDNRDGGHGTAVAGVAIYGDLNSCITSRHFSPSALLFSARVTDDNNEYAEQKLLETQLREAVKYFLDNYLMIKVVNISLGNKHRIAVDDSYQFRFAATIDELAYEYQDREVVFVVSTGNYTFEGLESLKDEEIYKLYPSFLLANQARLIDPATSALALTVGGLSYGEGRRSTSSEFTDRLVAGEQDWPSPFTRTGWGIDGAIKPDVVEYAGDYRFERGIIRDTPAQYAGLPTTARDFVPSAGKLFRTVAGTSFAAPRVANLAARLFREFPGASSNLIRALIAESAQIPDSRPSLFKDKEPWESELLRVYGYGKPDFERARWSAQQDVLLLAENTLPLEEDNAFQLFTIPSLPDEFLRIRGRNGYISVTLAFDPPTRHTRMGDYLGITMEFKLFRNTSFNKVEDALRKLTSEEQKAFRDSNRRVPSLGTLKAEQDLPPMIDLKPGVQLRNKGTLQHGSIRIAGSEWQYDGGPLILAVMCRRGWAPYSITRQRFATIVRLHHSDPFMELYNHVQQQTRVYQRARLRTNI